MADRVRKVSYCYVLVPDRAGQGVKVLGTLRDHGVNMLAWSGFPAKAGKSQLDIVCDDVARLRKIARTEGWRLSATKRGFLVQGADRVGAVHDQIEKLASAKVSVTAADAICAGDGRYGMILWVKPRDYNKAAKALGAS
jgi:hypothetical protein